MKRINIKPRPHWQQKCEAVGFRFYNMYGQPYWHEAACYHLSRLKIIDKYSTGLDITPSFSPFL